MSQRKTGTVWHHLCVESEKTEQTSECYKKGTDSQREHAMREREKWINLFKKRKAITGVKKRISSLEGLKENLVWKKLRVVIIDSTYWVAYQRSRKIE